MPLASHKAHYDADRDELAADVKQRAIRIRRKKSGRSLPVWHSYALLHTIPTPNPLAHLLIYSHGYRSICRTSPVAFVRFHAGTTPCNARTSY